MAPRFFEDLYTPVPRYFPQHTILECSSLCYFPNMKDQVPYPFKTAGNFIFLYKPIFIFLRKKAENKHSRLKSSKHFPNYLSKFIWIFKIWILERDYLSSRFILELRYCIFLSKGSSLNSRRFLDMVKETTVIVPSTEWMASVLSKDSHHFKIIREPIYIKYFLPSKYNTMQFD
jgi:hypothetical protein